MAEVAAMKDSGLAHRPPGLIAIEDLAAVWPAGENFFPSLDLVARLVTHNPAYWGEQGPYGKELTDTRLGRLLASAAKVTSTRPGGVGHRGYTYAVLIPVWQRLGIKLPDPPKEPGKSGEAGEPGGDASGPQPGSLAPQTLRVIQRGLGAENISGSKIACPRCDESIPAHLTNHWVCGWTA